MDGREFTVDEVRKRKSTAPGEYMWKGFYTRYIVDRDDFLLARPPNRKPTS